MVGAICLSQIRKDKKRILHPVAGWILTLLLVNIAWVFFRAPSLIGAWRILQQPFVNPLGSGIAETMSFLGIRGFAILRLLTTGISWLILERLPEEIDKNCQTQKGFCMAAVIFVVMVTVIEFHGLAGWHQAVKMHLFISGFNMDKRTVRRIVATALAVILAEQVFFLICGFGLPVQFGDTFMGELKSKYERLKETSGKRIVLVGGSGVAFDCDSA